MKRKIIWAVILLVVLSVVYYMPSIEKIVQKITNKYGSEVTQTEVNLSGFDLSIRKGVASIKDITVANPDGYKSPYAFELKDISVKLDIGTVANDVIIVNSVEIVEPVITYEMASFTKANLTDIQNNINSFVNKSASSKVETKEVKEEKTSKNEKKVIIEKLSVTDGKIQFLAPLMGKDPIALSLPTIMLNDIGKDKEGASAGEIISKVLGSINNAAVNIVSKEQLSKLKNNVGDVVDKAGDGLNSIKDGALDAGKNLKDLF